MVEKKLRASFTVEAALLMTLILPLLVTIIYASFYVHDRAVLKGAAAQVLSHACNSALEEDPAGSLQSLAQEAMEGRLLHTAGVTASVSAGKDSVSVSYSGSFSVPGLIMMFLKGNELRLSVRQTRTILRPASLIRKIRGMEKVFDTGT